MMNNLMKGICVLACAALAFSCNKYADFDYFDRDAVITDIYTSTSSVTLDPGGSHTVTCWPIPANADPMKLKWETSNPEVVLVSEWGTITAVGGGNTTITVSSGTVSKTISVTVNILYTLNGTGKTNNFGMGELPVEITGKVDGSGKTTLKMNIAGAAAVIDFNGEKE